MNHYSASGRTKSDLVKVQRPVAMLGIGVSDVTALTNETIKIYLEGSATQQDNIAPQISLLGICALSVHGQGGGYFNGGTVNFNVPIAKGGALEISDGTHLYAQLDGIKSAETYEIDTVDGGANVGTSVHYETKVVGSDDSVKRIAVDIFSVMCIRGVSHVSEINATLKPEFAGKDGNLSRKFSRKDLFAIEAEENDFAYEDATGLKRRFAQDLVCINVDRFSSLEFIKAAGNAVNLDFLR
ncbi:hypothetical protein BXY85_3747 [Roseivirga pacifica]|uniref:Uncharacterized protein n=1 Tax=Roseivirga pacifica TaxID=1267423 RepID=A0A1I0Q946_9BACT|nr:hypothetical protein [Roseivirga pacifica]RKQ43128.1 hypothetical protein BXY85_3747 [Roseivirga pacifica]SEW23531.1 hypothetical protein SAMN05216290_2128 [Roseivirga pacifica]